NDTEPFSSLLDVTCCHVPSPPRICSSLIVLAINGPASSNTTANIKQKIPIMIPFLNDEAYFNRRYSADDYIPTTPPCFPVVVQYIAAYTNRHPEAMYRVCLLQSFAHHQVQ